ncbi:MAG: ribokinase [Microbacterium sp.]|nr:ribokinase [Microbacterium sp.]
MPTASASRDWASPPWPGARSPRRSRDERAVAPCGAVDVSVVVLGSANLDTSVSMRRIPGPGETVLAAGAVAGAGGKGLNQAVAAARAGADTLFVGAVGADEAGGRLRDVLVDERVRVALGASERPTGTAFVMVADGGENAIVVVPGANGDDAVLGREVGAALSSLRAGDVVLAQLEVPVGVVAEAFRAARRRGATTVLNAAPSRELPADVLAEIDILVVNEHECLDLARGHGGGVEDAAAVLAESVGTVIVTLGEQGALLRSAETGVRIPAFPVAAVDTTAAGDTFCGALASRLSAGEAVDEAVVFASAAAALCVQRTGAAASAPTLHETQQFLADRAR